MDGRGSVPPGAVIVEDAEGRLLGRRVLAFAGDDDARAALTRRRIRLRDGILAWWAGARCPHPAAVRVGIRGTAGWVLAVESLDDLLTVAKGLWGASLLDLRDGSWTQLRTATGWQHEVEEIDVQQGSGDAYINPGPLTIRTNPREEGPYDTAWMPADPGSKRARLFTDFGVFLGGAPRQKQIDRDTNCSFERGFCPRGYVFTWTGLSVDLLGADDLPLRGRDFDRAVETCSVSFVGTCAPFWTLPMSAVVRRPPEPAGSADSTIQADLPVVFPFLVPLSLTGAEEPTISIYRGPLDFGFYARAWLAGILYRHVG